MHALSLALLFVLPALAIIAALRDVTSFTIPNWISGALAAAFLPAALAAGAPLATIGLGVAVGAAGLIVGMGMFAAGWVGGGDAKLLAACALWLGWPAVLPFLLATGLAGGALTLLLLALRSAWVEPALAGSPAWIRRLAAPGGDIPYGVAIAIGALAAFPQGALAAGLFA
ncbi:MAG: pilus assembly protein CpaA [Caulobacter sp.]|nr:pilus assembly protein CpaA [Caulobacter sp.]